jgi:hypothetical protein
MNFLFAFQLISFVSRPDMGQIVFKNRARLLVTKTFFNPFFERVQTRCSSYFIETPINSLDAAWSNLDKKANSPVFELARVLVRFDHVARIIVNANHRAM